MRSSYRSSAAMLAASMTSAVVCRALSAGELRIKSGWIFRLRKYLPMSGAAFSPRPLSGLSKSGRVASFQSDLACRNRKRVFISSLAPDKIIYGEYHRLDVNSETDGQDEKCLDAQSSSAIFMAATTNSASCLIVLGQRPATTSSPLAISSFKVRRIEKY